MSQKSSVPQLHPPVSLTLTPDNDHTDRYQFGLAVKPIMSEMLATQNGDTYSATVLQFLATAMHSDTQLMETNPGHNDYIADELAAYSWWWKGFPDNARTKYTEALADVKNTKFPSAEEKDVAVANIYETLADLASKQSQYVDEIADEEAAMLLGMTRDEHYVCHGFYELKRYENAIQACTDAINRTDNGAAYYWRGEACEHSGRPDQALVDLTRNADLQGYLASFAAIDMSVIYAKRHDYKNELSVLNKYTFLYDPDKTEKYDVAVAYNNRCYAYMQLGELKKALADCNQSLKYGNIPDAFSKKQQLLERLSVHKEGI